MAQAPSTATASMDRELWIDCQLTSSFLSSANTSTIGFAVALPVTLAVLYGYVEHLWLGLWGTAVLLLVSHRFWAGHSLGAMDWLQDPVNFLRRFKYHAWAWPLSSGTWAASLFLYFQRVPLENQFICLIVLIGMGAFSVSLMAARLDIFRRYVDYLAFMSILPIGTHAVFWARGSDNLRDVALMTLIFVFWRLLRKTGTRYHATSRQGFGLAYDNEHLIASLRLQSITAFEAIQAKDRFLANAAHDLRQPIHALAFYAELLRSDSKDAPQVVPKILTATDSVNTLFNSLFDFAKLESNGVQVNKQVMPVCELINQLVVQFSPAAHAKNLYFRNRITPAYVLTDSLLIQRILGNLLANAIRYSAHGGVLLSSRVRGDRVWLEVWDTGAGIAPEHLPYVFREFYKVPTLGTEEGFGLGLAIVQRLCNALDHKVYVRSSVGHGTRFRVELPLVPHSPYVPQLPLVQAPRAQQQRPIK